MFEVEDEVEALLKRPSDLADRAEAEEEPLREEGCSEDEPAYPVREVSMRR